MNLYKNIDKCRICSSTQLKEVMKIEKQYLSQGFVESNEGIELQQEKVPQTLLLCGECGLVQLRETVTQDVLYKKYFYRSAINDTMRRDLKNVVEDVTSRVELNDNDIVVDIGANDGTMIGYYPENLHRIGVEPATNIDWSNVDSSIEIKNDYFTKEVFDKETLDKKVKIFSCCAMFYDLDDPNSFVSDIKSCMHEDGMWCIQLSYLVSMLKNLNFYDICNEHLEYYSLHVLNTLMKRNGLKIVHASLNAVNGGSARVFVVHDNKDIPESEELKELYKEELEINIFDEQTYIDFNNNINEYKKKIKSVIDSELEKGNMIMGLGASTKGNMLLQTFGIDKSNMLYISERNPEKVGLKTLGTDFELISEERAREMKPSVMIVLPWYFKDEIVKREKDYIDTGGKLLFPMPYPHLVTNTGEINL